MMMTNRETEYWQTHDFEMQNQLEFLERFGITAEQIRNSKLESPFFDRCVRQWAILLPAQKMNLPCCPFCEEQDDLFLQIAWIAQPMQTIQKVDVTYRFWVQCGDMGCWTQGPMMGDAIAAVNAWSRRI